MHRHATNLRTTCSGCGASYSWLPAAVLATSGSHCRRCGGELEVAAPAIRTGVSRQGLPVAAPREA